MTTFLLIRHAHVDAVGNSLASRRGGVHLSEPGQREAEELADWLAGERIDRINSSPLERAQETAARLAERRGLRVEPAEELTEFDFGEWTGQSFADLDGDPRWRRFNAFRSGTRAPGGESMLEVQARAVACLQRLADACPGQSVAVVSHCDVIRAVLCHYLGMPLDLFHRLTVDPASVSTLRLEDYGPAVLTINAGPCPRMQ